MVNLHSDVTYDKMINLCVMLLLVYRFLASFSLNIVFIYGKLSLHYCPFTYCLMKMRFYILPILNEFIWLVRVGVTYNVIQILLL
jgi:hypothetical protein